MKLLVLAALGLTTTGNKIKLVTYNLILYSSLECNWKKEFNGFIYLYWYCTGTGTGVTDVYIVWSVNEDVTCL